MGSFKNGFWDFDLGVIELEPPQSRMLDSLIFLIFYKKDIKNTHNKWSMVGEKRAIVYPWTKCVDYAIANKKAKRVKKSEKTDPEI